MGQNTSKIRVYNSAYGKWETNAKVVLEWSGITNLGQSQAIYTNANGIAYVTHSSSGTATVYINGKNRGTMYTPGEADFSI